MLLYDSTSPFDIPVTAESVAYYCDGIYAVSEATVRARFPTQPLIRIAVFGQTNDGNALDVERGDATPSEAPQWVKWRHAAGIPQPWVYVNRSNRSTVENALIQEGIVSDQVALWVATLDGTQTVPAGPYPVAAVQYANSLSSGGHYDLSIVNDQFGPGGGTIGGYKDMPLLLQHSPGAGALAGAVYLCDAAGKLHLTPAMSAAVSAAFPGIQAVVADAALDEWPDAQPVVGAPEPTSVTGTFTGTIK